MCVDPFVFLITPVLLIACVVMSMSNSFSSMFLPPGKPMTWQTRRTALYRRLLLILLQRVLLMDPGTTEAQGWSSSWVLRLILRSGQVPRRILWRVSGERVCLDSCVD